jgi:hypothetical protein
MVRELLSLLVTFFLAGFFAGWIVLPTALGRWDRFFLSLALAVPATLLAGAVGLATHSLAAWNVALGITALAAGAAWRAKAALRGLWGRVRRPEFHLPRPQAVPVALIVCAAALTWFTVLVPEGIEDTGSGHPNGTIVYYHWGIVGRVVEAGGIPPTLPEWGRQREFPYEYAFSVSHGAATSSLAGNSGFVLEERYRIAMVIAALFATFALWRCWLPSWWAWIAAVLTLNVSRVETRLLVYKPEAFAFILLIWSAWLLDRAIGRRSRLWGALAGLVLASSFLAHPVSSLLVAPLWGGIILGHAAPPLWRRRPSALPWRPVLAAVVVFVVLFGSLRLVIGSTGQDLAQSPKNGIDETRVVYNLAYVSANPFARPNVPECNHPFGVYSTIRPFFSSNASWFFFDIHARSSVLLMLGALILLVGAILLQAPPRLARWPDSAKRAVITWSSYAVGVYLLAVLICVYYSTWVPQRVGPMRLMPYWALIFPILIAGVAWGGSRLLSQLRAPHFARFDRLDFRGRAGWLGHGVGLVPAVILSVATIWTFTTVTASQDRGVPPFEIASPRAGGLSPGAIDTYRWIDRNLPPSARILANGYTEGALGMLTRRMGLLDGRTPFAQPDPWRSEAIHLLSRSRAFFRHPASSAVPGAATYVAAGRPYVNLGGSYFPTDFRALARDPTLQRIHETGGVILYRVRSRDIGSIPPRSSGQLAVTRSSFRVGSGRGKWDLPVKSRSAAVHLGPQPSC